ncbi:sensor histidine kinase [Alsobacter metallidurans]|uniref:histidine kinase n=1 Tax=Alsobacter metallidurans TaxID=340221 RepID=A0A917IA94_9HYPH|nr:MHYT domain-containing protein [Alsobacter metallidurans]GGH27204.1 sensor histidine kinase [Alsobacter metallidurans]
MSHAGAHDTLLVALSIVIAVTAAYTALDLAARMRATSGWPAHGWLAASAIAMGGGVWSMHFVAMLAFQLPGVEVRYDLGLTLLSLALPILATAFGFFAVDRYRQSRPALLASGFVMGLGIAGMHYAGMAAMQMSAELTYARLTIALSVLIAIGAATLALWLAFRNSTVAERALAALIMGAAISGMHYVAMAGSTFSAVQSIRSLNDAADLSQTKLALWITSTTFLILVLALVAAMFDRHFAHLTSREATALRESEERFRLLVESVTDYAIFMLDRDGRVANWNAGAERIKGYTAQEIVGSHLSRFYTAEAQAVGAPEAALKTAATTGKFEDETWRVRKDGSLFWASIVIDPIRDAHGELVGYAKITRDVTERKQAQEALDRTREALAQSQKMEAVGQLTGGVAHDFNNLLMAILGSLDLLRKRVPTDDPRITRLIDNAIQGAERGASLTQRMLAFARRQDLKPRAVDLPDLVRGMTELLNRSIGPQIAIETRFPLGLPRVQVDANQLELALLNLVVNARDAMPGGGQITIGAREEHAPDGGATAARYASLWVQDTGEGMDEATLARAQEPFFTTKGVGKGTGLGLSMVHGLAEQSNGRLILKSRKGEGTIAEIRLPIAADAEPEAAPATVVPYPRTAPRAYTVLVVDDDPLVLENTAAMLEDLGHRVIEARSGREALEMASRARSLDVVVTDHVMPGMTGIELVERLNAERPGLPIILATGYAELSAAAQSLPRLNKPFDQNALARAVDQAVQGPGPEGVVAFRPKLA